MAHKLILIILALMIMGCQTGLVTGSSRKLSLIEKEEDIRKAEVNKANKAEEDQFREIYAGQTQIKIAKVNPNTSGSLYVLDSPKNDRYRDRQPLKAGDYIDVTVAAFRSEQKNGEKPAGSGAAAGTDSGSDKKNTNDAVVDTLKKAIPTLDIGDSKAALIRKIKFKINEIAEDGSLHLSFTRKSTNVDEHNAVDIAAVLPYEPQKREDEIATTDLTNIRWREVTDGQRTQRESDIWEDEYTLRLSGFSEARSKIALDLENKRQKLVEVKKQMENRLVAFGAERQTVAKEREKYEKLRSALEKEMRELKAELEKIRSIPEKPASENQKKDDAASPPKSAGAKAVTKEEGRESDAKLLKSETM